MHTCVYKVMNALPERGIKIQKIDLYGVKLLSIYPRILRTSCMYACKNVKEE